MAAPAWLTRWGRPSSVEEISWTVRIVALVVVAGFSLAADPGPGRHGRAALITLADLVLLGVVAAMAVPAVRSALDGRRRPVPYGLILTAALSSAMLGGLAPNSPSVCYPFVVASWIAVTVERRRAMLAIGGVLVVLLATLALGGQWRDSGLLTAILAAVTLGGLARRLRRERTRQLEVALAQAERAADAEAASAAAAERARIARELHDVLAHSIAALGLKIEAVDALLEAGQVERARAEVAGAAQLARDGLAESRQAIAALREDSQTLPDLLAALAAQTGTGPGGISLDVTGAIRPEPAAVRLALYRAAQEAVTNAHKHAPGGAIAVRLDYRPDALMLEVHNEPGSRAADPQATGLGAGLAGMRHRAAELGGTVSAGPDGQGARTGRTGWTVVVTVPA